MLDKQISQLANDTTLYLKGEHQFPLALQSIDQFTKASGLQLNSNKCEIIALQECSQLICDIEIKNEVIYLVIVISKDKIVENKNIGNSREMTDNSK